MNKKILRYAVAAVALLAFITFLTLRIPSVDVWLFRKAVMAGVDQAELRLAKSDELSVLLCGTGSPLPDKTRAGPCTLIAAGNRLYLVDAGIDAARNLRQWRVPLDAIDGILITHFHSDHIAELGELRLQTWVSGRKAPLAVFGPPGIDQVVNGFAQAYALDAGYRVEHHGADMLPPSALPMTPVPIEIGADGTRVVLSDGGLKITAIRVHHDPATPAYGYRFDYAGRSIIVSGDTTVSENLQRAAKGADVLVHEALSPELVGIMHDAFADAGRSRMANIMHDIPGYHTSPVDAAHVANEAGVKLLVYTHLVPVLPNFIAENAFLKGVSDVRPAGVLLGHDGDIIRLPGNTDRIEQAGVD